MKTTKPFYKENAMPFFIYLLLSICTLGFYTIYYHYTVKESMKKHNIGDDDELNRLFIVSIGTGIISFMSSLLGDLVPLLNLLSGIGYLASVAFTFMFVWKVATAVKEFADNNYTVLVQINPVVLFFFPGIGLNAMFNSLDESISYYHGEDSQNTVEVKEEA